MRGEEHNLGPEHRKYIRLDSVFPVQFRLESLDGKEILSPWLQGFTNNVGKGGIRLSVNNLSPEFANLLKEKKAKLSLEIDLPITKRPVRARACIAWTRGVFGVADKYFFGLSYDQINPADDKKILRYARVKQLFIPALLFVIVILGLGLAVNGFVNMRLAARNKALVSQLVRVSQETGIARQKIGRIIKERQSLESKLEVLQGRIRKAEDQRVVTEKKVVQQEAPRESAKILELNSLIAQLSREKSLLQGELSGLQNKEEAASQELVLLGQKKATLQKENFDKMYQWLKVHQNPRTGLAISFEGDGDIANWAFTYDQALLAQAFAFAGDLDRAKKILDFFCHRAKRSGCNFMNAYYANDGEPAEYTVHCGPNLWLGIAAVQYARKAQDPSYVGLAEEIAQGIIAIQREDPDGGLRGGPDVSWYSTEHNLDAYAFFNMLYRVTSNDSYRQARDDILGWLIKHTYGKDDLPVKRGKGDSTIATDTYAWSIAAIGPQKLKDIGMDPDKILQFAEENCAAEVSFLRPEGQTIKIKGFDFAPQRHLARGGVVSSEWTAQMVVSFKIMSGFYAKSGMSEKAEMYALKADDYLSELSSMIISSPSPSGQGQGCLPYATHDFVDTGHGWMTPKGSQTGSISGTAYALFAYYNYNPLELED